jgi:hypothetical protein
VDDPRATALARLVSAGDLFRRVHVDGSGGRAAAPGSTPDQDPVAAAAVRTIRRARRDAATTAAVAATAGAVAAGGS